MVNYYLFSLLVVLLSSNCQQSQAFQDGELLLNGLEGFHVITHNEFTYYQRIDSLFGEKKFKNLSPGHDLDFSSCAEASHRADEDFLRLRPQIIQFNGIMGEMPYQNEIYEQVLGLYIRNTGCTLIPFIDCYNDRIWRLLDRFYGTDVSNELASFDLQSECLAISPDLAQLVKVDAMPTIVPEDLTVASGNQSITCSCQHFIYGIFKIEVSRQGKAKILGYTKGNMDIGCQKKVTQFVEEATWKPASWQGKPIATIVAIQVANF